MEGQWNKIGKISDIQGFDSYLQKAVDGMSDEQECLIKQVNINKTLREEQRQLGSKLEELIWENNNLKIKNQVLSGKLKVSNDFIYTSENTLQNCKRNNRLHKCRKENRKLKKQIKELELELNSLKMSIQIVNSKNETCKPNNLSCGWDVE